MKTTAPTDAEIAKAIDDLRGDVQNLRLAAYVLDEYMNAELKSCHMKGHPSGFEYILSKSQVEGFTYMLNQVREMAASLEWSIDEAFDPSASEGKL